MGNLVVFNGGLMRGQSAHWKLKAATYIEAVYTALIQRFIDATSEHVREELAAGRAAPVADAEDCSFALVWMTERYLSLSLGTMPQRVSHDTAVRSLHEIWLRALYASVARAAPKRRPSDP